MSMNNFFTALVLLNVLFLGCDTKTNNVDACGDGFLDPGEQCDGSSLGGESCTSLGFYKTDGALACDADCRFDTTDCDTARCGDTIIQPDREDCEGENLGGQTCFSLGYSRGTLTCDADCHFDREGCESAGFCGDGLIQEPEVCEDVDLGQETCQSLGYYSGTLGCKEDCQFDLGDCSGRCGDGVVDEQHQEVCDGLNYNEVTCESLGFHGGDLVCSDDCRSMDEAGCEEEGRCGDDVVQPQYEDCDGTNTNGQTCQSIGFVSGALVCDGTCAFDISRCTMNYESPSIGTMQYVPGGIFQRDVTPTNQSVVSAFRMSRHEITRVQWLVVTGWSDPSNSAYSSGQGDPVQSVNWYHAISFCNKLSLLEGLTPVYSVSDVDFGTLAYDGVPTSGNATWDSVTANWVANGYRLPTEMELMWASMGADTADPGVVNLTGHSKAFSGSTGSNAIGDYAVFGYSTSETGRTMTERSNPVGSKLANELGLHDLSGNISEWVWDWLGTYPSGTLTDYRGPASGSFRVQRGGDWFSGASNCAISSRFNGAPFNRHYSLGFRVVRR
jgi:formylglycine-generating enzyme required for sulfatase activity